MYNQKRKLTKKQKIPTVDLSNDYMYGVELAKQLDYVKKTKKPVRCKVAKDWNHKEWLKLCFPEWQDIWIKKRVKMKWNERQRSFILTYIR